MPVLFEYCCMVFIQFFFGLPDLFFVPSGGSMIQGESLEDQMLRLLGDFVPQTPDRGLSLNPVGRLPSPNPLPPARSSDHPMAPNSGSLEPPLFVPHRNRRHELYDSTVLYFRLQVPLPLLRATGLPTCENAFVDNTLRT